MVNKIIITTAFVVLGSLLAACITSVDSALPYAQLPEITVATPFNLVASPSHPTAYLTSDLIAAGEKVQVIGTDKNAAWLLVLHNNLLGWMPTFYSRTNMATLKAPMVIDLLSDKCTKYWGATFAPNETWVSNTSGAVFVVGSIYRPQTGTQFDDAALAIEIDGSGTATKSDYVHTPLTASSAIILFGFALDHLQKGSQISFDLTDPSNETALFEAAFFSNDCSDAPDALVLPIGKTKTTVAEQGSLTKADSAPSTQQLSTVTPTPTPVVIKKASGFANSVSASIVVNGNFEVPNAGSRFVVYSAKQGIEGWTVANGSIDHIGRLWKAASGQQSIDLSGNEAGSIYQDLITAPGETYQLRFWYSGNPEGAPNLKQMQVWWGDTLVDTLISDTTGQTTNNFGWVETEYAVVAQAIVTRLKFTSLTAGVFGPTLDNVSVSLSVKPSKE